ncbi:hypothetical protein [Oerskovia enterophila]|uniref:hypothetical protein n=1 Tax=Oerskovia enterophila TaxID=43678 RepID=UPI003827C2C5
MTTSRPKGYRNYSADGTYWTVRKVGKVYWVVRINPASAGYAWEEVWGGYQVAGAAGGAAAQLAYGQAMRDAQSAISGSLHEALASIGLGVEKPSKPAVPPAEAPRGTQDDEEFDDDAA